MSARLLLAPAAAGKTAWVIDSVRTAALGLRCTPILVAPTPLQAQSLRMRLAQAGGALGVHILTFDQLHGLLLQQSAAAFTELVEPVRQRLLRVVVDELVQAGALPFYQSLAARPGFVTILDDLIAELKGARIDPATLIGTLDDRRQPPRLRELAAIYARYQRHLQANQWADRAGVGWLALEQVEQPAFVWPAAWSPLFFDGFDSFTKVQLAVLAGLARKAPAVVVTLTGSAATLRGEQPIHPAHQLFVETAGFLRQALNVAAEPLPVLARATAPPLVAIVESIFVPNAPPAPAAGVVDLIAATNRTGEVRAALRWLKMRIVQEGCTPAQVALLARSLSPYRDIIAQVAAEFGVPVRFADGLPLRTNPAVAALLALLRSFVPDTRSGEPLLLRRPVVEAWRSPYFDFGVRAGDEGHAPGLADGDAERLDAAARQGRVIGGLAQWRAALAALAQLDPAALPAHFPAAPVGAEAQTLLDKFDRFIQVLTAPASAATMAGFTGWLEDLIGAGTAAGEEQGASHATPVFSLKLITQFATGDPSDQERDQAAIRALKEVLRGLVWAEAALAIPAASPAVDYPYFVNELAGAVDAATYHLPVDREDAVLVATTVQARGVPFRAVAVMGLAEGELPARGVEDPFLRDADRAMLRDAGLPLESSTRSSEREYFYMTLARAAERLLLTRPRLADNGAEWEASPYWDDVCRLSAVQPLLARNEQPVTPAQAASLEELLEALARWPDPSAFDWLRGAYGDRLDQLAQARTVLQARHSGRGAGALGIYDGDLTRAQELLDAARPKLQRWSASKLERYRTCPYWFYLTALLGVEERVDPEEGADLAQTGNIYHRILEQVYQAVADPTDLPALLDALPGVAARVLDAAPAAEGFRVTAWWTQTRVEIEANVHRSLEALALLEGRPSAFEQPFTGARALVVRRGEDEFALSGMIDRIDRLPNGRLCVVDYKTGVGDYDKADALKQGKRLQVALYALAAQDALQLGTVADGLYWFVHKARPSAWSLATFEGGTPAALALAVDYAWEAVDGARRGEFMPRPPDDGCPDYCPAAAFCWRYRPQR